MHLYDGVGVIVPSIARLENRNGSLQLDIVQVSIKFGPIKQVVPHSHNPFYVTAG